MNPSISKVLDAEMLRDGGSFMAKLLNDRNNNCILFIKVEIKIIESGKWLRFKYEEPVLAMGAINEGKTISWLEGLKILSMPNEISSEIHLEWLNNMINIFELNGEVPESLKYVGA